MNEKKPDNNLIVATSPHVHAPINIQKVMGEVLIALIPAVIASLYFFRLYAFKVLFIATASSVFFEYIWQKVNKQPIRINDLSAALTGILLALTLPPTIPWWMIIIGSMVSVILGKQVFGGLGHNPFNPALVGRAFLQVSWPQAMTTWVTPFDAVSTATPLAIKKLGLQEVIPSYFDLFLGNCSGSLGETSALALILGGIFLIKREHIFAITPFTYIITFIIGILAFGQDVLFHVFSGGLMLGAFFMATDPVTTPMSKQGKFIFGLGCGILTVLIRLKGGFPEGVCFSILIMNMTVPLIDKYTIPKPFGVKKG
ncbi:MAG: RnfABCDGE type electron transport complex subunit D [Endomicrobiales bacterium]|nr:RnfABCDGE type electron transport complex subunit D [Endomicrobiales bacterium]